MTMLRRLVCEDEGDTVLAYAVVVGATVTGLTTFIVQPQLVAAAFYRMGDLLSLFGSQVAYLW